MKPKKIRLSIALDEDVHSVYSNLAKVSGSSLSSCIGAWLRDTMEGAQFVEGKVSEFRRAPRAMLRDLQATGLGLGSMAGGLLEEVRKGGDRIGAARRVDLAPPVSAPSSNTGLNSPKTRRRAA